MQGRVAGIDYGTVRIGIAVSDSGRTLASPLESYVRRNAELDARRFHRLVAKEGIVLWVVGLPVHLDGREGRSAQAARRFGQWLGEVTALPVEFYDGALTSHEAEQLLLGAELTRKRRKKRIDMLAAQIMLTAYLEAGPQGPAAPGPLDDAP